MKAGLSEFQPRFLNAGKAIRQIRTIGEEKTG